ncbi:MAG: HlyD family secretion protein [Bacteroidales bacterium]|jgi:HlyD family secretion protein|nr:HlyD family secretion protein [Bacteroidales bacterium]
MDEEKDIELRSEEVQEILGNVPSWIVRWGISVLCVIVLLLLVGSYVFKYPDTIHASMIVTAETPPAHIVAKTNGRIKELFIGDNQHIGANEYLAVLENPASTGDMLRLKHNLTAFMNSTDSSAKFSQEELHLGAVQVAYTAFIRSLNAYETFVELHYFPQKIAAIEERIAHYKQQYQNLERQQRIAEEQYVIAEKLHNRTVSLYAKEIISQEMLEKSQNDFLHNRLLLENARAAFKNVQIQISELQETLLDAEQQYADSKNVLELEVSTLASELLSEITAWEQNFVFISPIEGTVSFAGYWSEHQNVSTGETVFSILPTHKNTMIGKAQLPIARSGKVQSGQRVNIRFANYPDTEFGMVQGEVRAISLVPVHDYYLAEIALPRGLLTTYHKTLPLSQEMTATIEIITADMRLIERLLLPFKRLWTERL